MKYIDLRNSELNIDNFLEKREQNSYESQQKIVNEIIENVRINKDNALLEYTEKFDGISLTKQQLKVTKQEIKEAYELVDNKLIEVIKRAYKRIYEYHYKQKKYSWFDTDSYGTMLGQKITPIERVGVYVPGGTAVYPSSVLMNVIPAIVAGVSEIAMTTPMLKNGTINPATLVAADICGVSEIYKIGGAQAIAALAYGTESIKKVYKIVGPGNIFVALAKKGVYGTVGIDSIAGPSEVLVIADETSNPKWVMADLLSQAEHDTLAACILVTDSEKIAIEVKEKIEDMANSLSRSKIMLESLNNYGTIILVDNIDNAVKISDMIAPEHLEICTKEPVQVMNKVKNAGAIFLGNYSPEPLGDYMAGPNHVLPTNGSAKYFSALSIDMFIKKSSVIYFNKEALDDLKDDIMYFADSEQLTAHANAIGVRYE